jgi:hypothetical protein
MKSTKNLVSIAILIAAIITVSFRSLYSVAQTQKVPTKKELVALLKTAKEPPEHLRIAAYYRQEAQRLTADARYHDEMGEAYQGRALPYESKHPYGTLGVSHCHYWAELDLKQVKEAQALAVLHENMAKEAAQKQQ